MFESTGIINRNILIEIKKPCLPLPFKFIFYVLPIWFILLGMFNFILNDIFATISCILFGVLTIIVTSFVMKRPNKLTLKRFKECYGKEEMNLRVYFEENNVVINNLENNGIEYMKYDIFYKLKETKNVFILISKCNQFVLVFKDSLDTNAQYEFKKFISNKCKLKVKL